MIGWLSAFNMSFNYVLVTFMYFGSNYCFGFGFFCIYFVNALRVVHALSCCLVSILSLDIGECGISCTSKGNKKILTKPNFLGP